MPGLNSIWNHRINQTRQSLSSMMTGGEWAIGLPHLVRQNLTWFWSDGFFSAASDNIVVAYLTVYLLALGASGTQIGLLSALSSLTAALILFPGAILVERSGNRKWVSLGSGGLTGRAAIFMMAVLPFLAGGQTLVYLVMGFSILRDSMINLGYPAWMSLTADIVPLEGRGRYFASRNFATGLAGIVSTLLVGLLITSFVKPVGYELAFGLACLLGLVSAYSFGKITDPRPIRIPQVKERLGMSKFFHGMNKQPVFLMLCAMTCIWNLSLNIAGPFFSVHLVENLGANAAMVGFTTIATGVGNILSQRRLGELSDRWGARRMQMVSAFLIPIIPLMWYLARNPWQIAAINLVSGGIWAAYNLSSFNFLLAVTPVNDRPRYSAVYQLVVTASLAIGAAIGSVMVTWWGYPGVFLVSAGGRLLAALMFLKYFHVRKEVPKDKPG